MAPRRGYADGPFGQVHYRECGKGKALILCHQAPTSSVQFIKAMPWLAEAGLHVIAVDAPGYGMSDFTPDAPSIADYAASVMAVADHLKIDKASFLGHHTGAMVITEIALSHPDRVERLILNGPAPLTEEERQEWTNKIVTREKAWTIKSDGSHFMELWQRRTSNTPGWQDAHSMNAHVLQTLLAGERHWYGHNAAFAYDHMGTLKQLKHPCLILTNTGDDVYDLALRARDMRPDFDFVELSGGTHDIVDEQPKEWADAVAHYVNP